MCSACINSHSLGSRPTPPVRGLMPTSASSKCSGGSPHRRAIPLQNPQHLGAGGCRVMLPQPGGAGVLLAERCCRPLLELLLVKPA